VRLEGIGQLKNPMTSMGIELATFRLAAQCLDQQQEITHIGKFNEFYNISKIKNYKPQKIIKIKKG
jgi:hypothetical protein